MGRAPCCDEKVALKKGPWTPDEDQKLVAYIQEHGHGSWRALPEKAGLARCGKSCRLRWTNYLRPDIKRGRFSHEEDQMIIQLHAILGNRWSAIASHLPRRTDNEIKNYWNTHLKKRLAQMGIDPVTHQTSTAGLALSPAWTPLVSTQLTHTTQWHCALAEAEGRLSRSSVPTLGDHHQLIHGSTGVTPHPSSLFMRSWKTRVEDTLRPTFGAVKLEPAAESRNLNQPQIIKPRQDWNATLGITQAPFLEKYYSANIVTNQFDPTQSLRHVSTSDDQLQVKLMPDYSLPMMDMTTFTDAEIRADSGAFDHFAAGVGLENHFSPTSILQGPDSDSCSGSGDNVNSDHISKFEDFLHQGSSSYHRFPLIDGEYDDSASVSCDIPESFWQAPQPAADQDHQTNLLADLKMSLDDGNSPILHVQGGDDSDHHHHQELERLIEVSTSLPLTCFGGVPNIHHNGGQYSGPHASSSSWAVSE